jgi:cholesterol oxidase
VGIGAAPIPDFLRQRLRRGLLLVAMGADAADGEVRLDGGRLCVRYDLATSPVFERARAIFDRLGESSGRPVRPLKRTFTVHPLGGAVLAANPREGVVDGRGQVFGHEGLYVIDGAALPGAPGGPPSMSIAAWSSWVATRFVDERGSAG